MRDGRCQRDLACFKSLPLARFPGKKTDKIWQPRLQSEFQGSWSYTEEPRLKPNQTRPNQTKPDQTRHSPARAYGIALIHTWWELCKVELSFSTSLPLPFLIPSYLLACVWNACCGAHLEVRRPYRSEFSPAIMGPQPVWLGHKGLDPLSHSAFLEIVCLVLEHWKWVSAPIFRKIQNQVL